VVDGQPVAAVTRVHHGRTATLIDLPTVAVVVSALEEQGHLLSPLANVVDALDRYI
jgi:hypothetical protein